MPFTIGGEWKQGPSPSKPKQPVKVRKEKRRSSFVTIIQHLPYESPELKNICSALKKKIGCGGSVKGDTIELQISKAFDDKEREWVISDLGLDKEDATAADKFFKLTITKVGLVEKAEMNEEFYETIYPARGIKTEDEFREAVKAEI